MKKSLSRGLESIAVLAALLPGPAARAQGDDLSRLAWLAGCWKSDTAEAGSVEQWMPPAGGTMLGMSRTVRQGRTVEFEFLQIRAQPDGKLAYVAQPSGQPTATFPLLRLGDTEAAFENPQHDFPQRVVYQLAEGGSKLKARIEGLRGGKLRVIEFPMSRASCDAPDGNLATR